MPAKSTPPPSPAPAPDQLLVHLRACLHLLISADPAAERGKLQNLPGPGLASFCFALAESPNHVLASELARPVIALLQEFCTVANDCDATLRRADEPSRAIHGRCRAVLDQLDLALGFILRNCNTGLCFRAEATRDTDFLCAVLVADTQAGGRIARMLRRFAQLHPNDPPEDSFMVEYALDVYQRVAELDRLADEFPDSIREAARQMPAWPMLMPRHTSNRRRFLELADRLELGREYPLDTSKTARFRPDTPLVRYLEPIMQRLYPFYLSTVDEHYASPVKEAEALTRAWWQWPETLPDAEMLLILRATRRLPPLTKATALAWAEVALVPLILATDARDYRTCTEPALKNIARQRGVKSPATFKSRLLAAVTATLRRLARSA